MNKIELVQVLNPKSKRYILIDTTNGKILKYHSRRNTPYKNVPIAKIASE